MLKTFRKLLPSALAGLILFTTPMLASANIKQIYDDSCAACHDTGGLNAIKKGDTAAWNQIKAEKGMDALIKSVKNGMPQMPAGGLCQDCSDAEYQALIEYMSK